MGAKIRSILNSISRSFLSSPLRIPRSRIWRVIRRRGVKYLIRYSSAIFLSNWPSAISSVITFPLELVIKAARLAAPIAGRLADRGWTRKLTGIAFITAASSFAITHISQSNQTISLILFCTAAILLDMAVSGNLVLGQQVIYGLGDEIRGRVNGVFMAVFFAGGAIGSALGGWAYAHGNWATASILGFSLPILAFIYYLTEKILN